MNFLLRSHRFTLTTVAAGLSLALFVACSSTTTTGSPASTGDSGTAPPDDASAADGGLDSGDAGTTELLQIQFLTTPARSCADACGSEKYTCAATCSFSDVGTAAGEALYDGVGTDTKTAIATCTDVPPTTNGQQGLNSVVCCCESRAHQKIAGSSPPTSCDDVCTAKGLACDDFTIWDEPDTTTYQGGAHELYAGNGDTAYHVDACATVPAADYKGRTLESYACGCY